jgi:hypothetical protein
LNLNSMCLLTVKNVSRKDTIEKDNVKSTKLRRAKKKTMIKTEVKKIKKKWKDERKLVLDF